MAVLGAIVLGFGILGYVLGRFFGRQEGKQRTFTTFMLRFVAVFGLSLGLEALVLWLFPFVHLLLRDSVAALVCGILRRVGMDATVAGPVIFIENPPLIFDITVACLGGVLFWVYVALVSAESGATQMQRVRGILIGLAMLLMFNLFRIVLSIYLEGTVGASVHDYFYGVNMLVVLLIWLGWVRTVKPKREALVGSQ